MELTEPQTPSTGVVIINGGTQGLGEAVARKLVSDGADGLVLTGRSADRGAALAAELESLGTPTVFARADMSDRQAHGGEPKLTAYAMSKGGMTVMTRNLAYGLMRHGIRVNQVNPGWMETESEHKTQIEQDDQPENWLELAGPGQPLGRLVQPWEVANASAYCLSPGSGLMTGNVIDIDQSVQGAGDPPMPDEDDTVYP